MLVLVFDQHRRLQVAPVGNQRVVRVELLLDVRRLEHLLDPQHFLDLVADRQLVLEQQRDMLAQVNGAVALVRDHARAKRGAFLRIRFERQEAGAGEGRHQSSP